MENELVRRVEKVAVKVRTPRYLGGFIKVYTENSGKDSRPDDIITEEAPHTFYTFLSKIGSYVKRFLMPLPHIRINPRISISQDNRKVYG